MQRDIEGRPTKTLFRLGGAAAFGSLLLGMIGGQALVDRYDVTHHPIVIGRVTATAFLRGGRSPIMRATIDFRPDPASPAICSGSAKLPYGVRFVVGQSVEVVPHARGCTPVLVDYVGRPGLMLGLAAALAGSAVLLTTIAYRGRWPKPPKNVAEAIR